MRPEQCQRFVLDDLAWILGTPPKCLLPENETKLSAKNLAEARSNTTSRHEHQIVRGSLQSVSNEDMNVKCQEEIITLFHQGK